MHYVARRGEAGKEEKAGNLPLVAVEPEIKQANIWYDKNFVPNFKF